MSSNLPSSLPLSSSIQQDEVDKLSSDKDSYLKKSRGGIAWTIDKEDTVSNNAKPTKIFEHLHGSPRGKMKEASPRKKLDFSAALAAASAKWKVSTNSISANSKSNNEEPDYPNEKNLKAAFERGMKKGKGK